MKKPFLCLTLLLLLTGCLQLEQTITLKRDGSATIYLCYQIPEKHVASMQAAHQAISGWQGNTAVNWFFDEQAVRNFYQQPQHGVNVLIYKNYRKNDNLVVEIALQAKNAQQAFARGYFGNLRLEGRKLSVQLPDKLDQLPSKQIDNLRKLCGNLSISLEVIAPDELKSTNGYQKGKHTAFWKLSADGHGMDIFGKLQDLEVSW